MTTITLRCSCCGLPWAKLIDNVLEVQSRHNSAVHVNRISLATLREVMLFTEPDANLRPEREGDYHDND